VSNKVKELLSVHNIGQRVFAKQVLGLSQGTVSELLSKPKHWDKLTEKGRESYRKMYHWLQDIRNIDALKNVSPRKRMYTYSSRHKIFVLALGFDANRKPRHCVKNIFLIF